MQRPKSGILLLAKPSQQLLSMVVVTMGKTAFVNLYQFSRRDDTAADMACWHTR